MSQLYIMVALGYNEAVIPYSNERMAAIADLAEHLTCIENRFSKPLVTSASKVDLDIRVVNAELLPPTAPDNEDETESPSTENA